MNTLSFVALLISGHTLGSLLIYANHRFILHGKLGKIGPLVRAKHLHALHHKHAYDNDYAYFSQTPKIAVVAVWMTVASVCLLSVPFGLGLASAYVFYEYAHEKIHTSWRSSKYGQHHETHHKFPKGNFAGVHPRIDYLFRTNHKKKTE